MFYLFVNSTWPRRSIDGQMGLDSLRSAIALLLSPRGLEVSLTVNCILLALEEP